MQKQQLIDNRYEINQLLEQSDTTKIYSAYDIKLQRLVTLKILAQNNLSAKEAQAIAQLKHHNIVTVFDYGSNYIVMEHIAGQNLRKYCKEQPNLSIKWIANTIQQIADALYHAHRESIIHRDLKPTNIIVHSGIPKITDFGQAKYLDETTSSEIIRDVLPYMAPEQLQQNPQVDQRTDIYAIGIILYELLTKRNPFADVTLTNVQRIEKEIPPRPRSINKSIPHFLEKICMKCLAKNKKRRYQSARTLARDLDKFVHRKTHISNYVPWILFLCLLGFNMHSDKKRIFSQPTAKKICPTNTVAQRLNRYPIVQKRDENFPIEERVNLPSVIHVKFLLNYALSQRQADKRQQTIVKVIAIAKKAIDSSSQTEDIEFLHFLCHLATRISPLFAKKDSLATFKSPQREIEYYSNAVLQLRHVKANPQKLRQILKMVNQGIRVCRSFVFLYEIKAKILHIMSRHDEALKCYKKALHYEPHNPFILCARTEYFYATNNFKAAQKDIKTSLDYNVTIPQTWYLHTRLLKQQQLYTEAIGSITRALELGYSPHKCYYQRQSLYRKQQQYHKALADCNALLSLEKKPSYYNARAEIYAQLNQTQNAIKDLQTSHNLSPDDKKIILRIANLYKKLGDLPKVKKWLLKYTSSEK
ncbi:serine/threonine-protein kinase [Candidatus Uabimicrobium amorphum]|uniref:Protein kinase n=1 Tax=Uabimicrobium amorphum TaxID=2596890 RepID=A0A5S9F486_UABAM|nr:serine/threonine-protein kinase [Candidatus Uabimicrobium amorphum]BBM84214.1 protein kinase [Candidatus Uabimicrobium amorphum]